MNGDPAPIQKHLLRRVQRYDSEIGKNVQTALATHPWRTSQPSAAHVGPSVTKLVRLGQEDFSMLTSIVEWASRLKWRLGPGQVSFIELAIDIEASTRILLESKGP